MTAQHSSLEHGDLKWFPKKVLCCEDGTPMHFVFSIHIPEEKYADVLQLMERSGASVSKSLAEATPHSILIVDHNDLVSFQAPAFKYTFIMECLRESKIVELSDHRQSKTSLIARDINLLDVVYYKTKTWSSVLTDVEKKWLINEGDAKTLKKGEHEFEDEKCEKCSALIPSLFRRYLQERNANKEGKNSVPEDKGAQMDEKKCPHHDVGFNTEGKSSESSEKEQEILNLKCNKKTSNKPTIEEVSESIKQGKEWDVSSKPNSCQGLSKTSKTIKKKRYCRQERDPGKKHKNVVSEGKGAKRDIDNCSDHDLSFDTEEKSTESSDDGEEILKSKYFNKRTLNNDEVEEDPEFLKIIQEVVGSTSNNPSSAQGVWKTSRRASRHVVEPDSTRDDPLENDNQKEEKNKDPKRSRAPYTDEERSNILNYIVKHKKFYNIKGRSLWVTMERRKVCPIRTWQSMKEHYIKQIILRLDSYTFLSHEDRRKLKEGFYG